MQGIEFQKDKITIHQAYTAVEVENVIEDILQKKEELLPQANDSLILLKPNLNNDLNALMGNSTDLRVIVAVIKALQRRGYTNLVIGDGCNCGVLRRQIDVFARLRVDRLAAKFGVRIVNLNTEPGREINLTQGDKANIAAICFEADAFINLPTIKTHFEAQMSCACKNLVGCLAGRSEKKKLHDNLIANILRLNEEIKPTLQIVDGLVAMEGNGPGDGVPKKLGFIAAGSNAFLVDLTIAHLVGFELDEVQYLALARQKGYISEGDISLLQSVEKITNLEKAPKRPLLARMLTHSMFNGFKDALRPIHSAMPMMRLLYKLRFIQDVYESADADIIEMCYHSEKCTRNERCVDVCPMQLKVNSTDFSFSNNDCIQCFYCYFVCPNDAISIEGNLGFLEPQIRKYEKHTRKL